MRTKVIEDSFQNNSISSRGFCSGHCSPIGIVHELMRWTNGNGTWCSQDFQKYEVRTVVYSWV